MPTGPGGGYNWVPPTTSTPYYWISHYWKEDDLHPWQNIFLEEWPSKIPQEDEGMTYLNIPPVTGKTPAQVAQELRTLVKNKIWPALGGEDSGATHDADYWKKRATTARMELNALLLQLGHDLNRLEEIAKVRRPSETKAFIGSMRSGTLYLMTETSSSMGVYVKKALAASPKDQDNAALREHVQRAYALIQALPAIENPTSDKAASTIRAITSIIKVHYGLEFDADESQLPNVMAELLTQIKNAKEKVEPFVPVMDPEGLVELPPLPVPPVLYTLHNDATGYTFMPADIKMIDPHLESYNYGPAEWDEDFDKNLISVKNWNGGECSFEQALAALRAARKRFSAGPYSLRKGNLIFAVAWEGKDIEVISAPKGEAHHNVTETPFVLYNVYGEKKSVMMDSSIKHAKKDHLGFGQAADGVGSNAYWNEGLCSYEQAVQTLKAVRNQFSDDTFALYKDGVELAVAKQGHPIVYLEIPVAT